MDSTFVLIGLEVCFHSANKHENDVSNLVGCLQVVRIYNFMVEVKVYICASYNVIVFFFKVENKIYKRNKICSSCNNNNNNNNIYYIDASILPKNRQFVFSIQNYIRDTSEIFSIFSLVKISLTSFLCFPLFFI